MKKTLSKRFTFPRIVVKPLFPIELKAKPFLFLKLKVSLFLIFVSTSLWAQQTTLPPHILTADGTIVVPAGVTQMDVEAWGGGGAGGGASGSILIGRSGAGGGGGAYAKGKITVIAGLTLLSVKVAGTTLGTISNGDAGGNSTILGFEKVIFAAGGGGGNANNSGGIPAAGKGGLASASYGSITKTSGLDGGPGIITILNLFSTSAVGGNAGGPGGGLGAAGAGSVLLTNYDGNPGNPPGGGGSGGLNIGGFTAQ